METLLKYIVSRSLICSSISWESIQIPAVCELCELLIYLMIYKRQVTVLAIHIAYGFGPVYQVPGTKEGDWESLLHFSIILYRLSVCAMELLSIDLTNISDVEKCHLENFTHLKMYQYICSK
jgi:hypothetical protein